MPVHKSVSLREATETTVNTENVIPAKAGTQLSVRGVMGPGFRRDDVQYFLSVRDG